jgi:hypothetical protein
MGELQIYYCDNDAVHADPVGLDFGQFDAYYKVSEVAPSLARLASYDACLAEVQGERSEVKTIISRARQWITDGEVSTLLSYIEDLQRDEARNRNAIKLHLETIADLQRRLDLQHKSVYFLERTNSATSHSLNLAKSLLSAAEARERVLIERLKVSPVMVERVFVVMRKFDCFFCFADDTLRTLIVDWLGIALAAQPAAVEQGENNSPL